MNTRVNIERAPSAIDKAMAQMGQLAQALLEINSGKCARGGYVFGKLMKDVFESDASLSSLVWNSGSELFNKAAGSVKNVGKKAKEGLSSAFKAVKGLFGSDEL